MPSNVSQGAEGHRARLRHRDHLLRSDGGLRRRDPPGARRSSRRTRTRTSTPTSTRTRRTRSRTTTARAPRSSTPSATASRTSSPGLGTTGTMMGTTRRLQEHARPIRCVAVEPAEALHGLEGLKHLASSLVPPIYDAARPRRDHAASRPRTAGTWPIASRARRGSTSGTRRAPTSSRRSRSPSELQREQGGGCVVADRLRPRRPLLRADEVGAALRLVG